MTPPGSPASVLSAAADLSAPDTAVPAGFVVDLADARDTVRPSAIEGIDSETDGWGSGRAAPFVAVVAVAAVPGQLEPPAPQQPHTPLAAPRTSVPAALGSRAPPVA